MKDRRAVVGQVCEVCGVKFGPRPNGKGGWLPDIGRSTKNPKRCIAHETVVMSWRSYT